MLLRPPVQEPNNATRILHLVQALNKVFKVLATAARVFRSGPALMYVSLYGDILADAPGGKDRLPIYKMLREQFSQERLYENWGNPMPELEICHIAP